MTTTRLAVLSDVHADVDALRDALRQAELLGCEKVVCCGDLVDYGRHPEQTLALLRERNIPCIRGNHDRWALGKPSVSALSDDALAFLASLPTALDLVMEGVRIAVRHARHGSDMEGIYPGRESPEELHRLLAKAEADVLLCGHTHLPFRLVAAGGLVCNPGALLRDAAQQMTVQHFNPRTGGLEAASLPPGGTFGVLELPSLRFTIHRAEDGTVV